MAKFAKRKDIQYTLLSDDKSAAIRAFGVVNPAYGPGSWGYGVALPAIFVVDKDGVVKSRFMKSDYRERPEIDMVLKSLNAE